MKFTPSKFTFWDLWIVENSQEFLGILKSSQEVGNQFRRGDSISVWAIRYRCERFDIGVSDSISVWAIRYRCERFDIGVSDSISVWAIRYRCERFDIGVSDSISVWAIRYRCERFDIGVSDSISLTPISNRSHRYRIAHTDIESLTPISNRSHRWAIRYRCERFDIGVSDSISVWAIRIRCALVGHRTAHYWRPCRKDGGVSWRWRGWSIQFSIHEEETRRTFWVAHTDIESLTPISYCVGLPMVQCLMAQVSGIFNWNQTWRMIRYSIANSVMKRSSWMTSFAQVVEENSTLKKMLLDITLKQNTNTISFLYSSPSIMA